MVVVVPRLEINSPMISSIIAALSHPLKQPHFVRQSYLLRQPHFCVAALSLEAASSCQEIFALLPPFARQ